MTTTVEPYAGQDRAWWVTVQVTTDRPPRAPSFYSSHDAEADARALCAKAQAVADASDRPGRLVYSVVPRPPIVAAPEQQSAEQSLPPPRRSSRGRMPVESGCCEEAKDFVCYRAADDLTGPDADGWSIPNGAYQEAWETTYVIARFCPFCGKSLAEINVAPPREGGAAP